MLASRRSPEEGRPYREGTHVVTGPLRASSSPGKETAMTQKTMTEKDMFLQTLQREVEITTKLLKAFPANKDDFKPHEKSRTAKELAWNFVLEQGIADAALKGQIDFSKPMPAPPGSLGEVIAAFEKASRETDAKVSKASEDDLNRTVQWPIGPGKIGDFRAMDVLWISLMDQVHHRGQLSVYQRLAGGKVPSIYGPTADEPWM
jgi:uncharacterized damage-inducible protein DinB